MRIGTRVRKLLEARRPACRLVELRIEGEGAPVTERDRCPGCGRCHVIVVREEVVESVALPQPR
jgi:uncharacterized protein with PIN domain